MSAVYAESSALLAWLLAEERSEEVRLALESATSLLTSSLTFVEVERALLRVGAEGVLREGDIQRLRGMLHRLRPECSVMEVSEDVLERASRAFPVEPVRTLDALHLATALEFARGYHDLRILSHDRRISDNAEALGLA